MESYLIYSLIFAVTLVIFYLIYLNYRINKIYKKSEVLFENVDGKGLAALINKYFKGVKSVEDHCYDLDKKTKNIDKISAQGLHRTGFVRYNPFGDVGGNQSFSLCLLNTELNGFVISSIHSREGTRVYAKTISKGEGDYNLSAEEKQAIELAKK